MSFCSRCGAEIGFGANFCPNCGQPVSGAPGSVPTPAPVMPTPNAQDYSLVLVSTGSCPRSSADDVLEDFLGYSNSESNALVRSTPVQIAQYLTAQQAQYLAQALTEYGMQVSVFYGANPVDLGQYATGPVYNADGSFAAGAFAALATLTLVNRVNDFRPWGRPIPTHYLFAPRYRPPAPPRHIRRSVWRREPPRRDPGPGPRHDPGPGGPGGPGGAPKGGPSGGPGGPGGAPKGGPSGGPGGRR